MHKQTRACDISRKVKERVWERDEGRCVLCGTHHTASPNAHFIARSQGGLGVEENIVTLCLLCHSKYDNSDQRSALRDRLRGYLKTKYEDWDESKLYYKKWREL